MIEKAHAKINLSLNVVGKYENGYHELDMIMMPLALHDEVEIELADNDCFTCDDANLLMDESNTIYKAVKLMRSTFQLKEHFHIHIKKNIPAQAGLAGGSADGAAVLRAINKLCNLHQTLEDLAAIGKQIGADVPFCVMEQCAIVQGIGEKIETFTYHQPIHVLLVKPNTGVSTKEAFEMLDFKACVHPASKIVKEKLLHGNLTELSKVLGNSLEYSAFQLVPEIANIKTELLTFGLPIVLMSGSGSTVFALSTSEEEIDKAIQLYRHKSYFICKTTFI